MVRIFIAVTVCYFAGTAAGRGFLPYSLGVPASNFKNDVDMLAVTGMRMTNPDLVKHAVSGMTLDGFRGVADSVGARR